MADVTGLKARLVERAGRRVDVARLSMGDQLLTAAGEGLSRESVETTSPIFSPPGRWVSSLRVSGSVTTWQWNYGARDDRGDPFDPWHTDLDGLAFDEHTYLDVLSKDPADYPYGNHWWFPGDHKGCACQVEIVAGSRPFPLTPDARTVKAGGMTVTIEQDRTTVNTGALPAWWVAVANSGNWRRTLDEASDG